LGNDIRWSILAAPYVLVELGRLKRIEFVQAKTSLDPCGSFDDFEGKGASEYKQTAMLLAQVAGGHFCCSSLQKYCIMSR
jgi:hypothetical protein